MIKSGKIIVFSDSHGDSKAMKKAVLTHSPDAICHLGDYVRDSAELRPAFPGIPLYSVKGNCDLGSDAPSDLCFSLFGFRIFACHGHLYSVKRGFLNLYYAAKENSADICLFGHTHRPYIEERAEITLLNPGASGDRFGNYALIDFFEDKFKAQIYYV